MFTRLGEVSQLTFILYNAILLIGFIWFLYKYRHNSVCTGIIILFFSGMFSDLLGSYFNFFKIFILLYALFLLYKTKSLFVISKIKVQFIGLLLFVGYCFITSCITHGDGFFSVLSQMSKYIIPFCYVLIFVNVLRFRKKYLSIENMFHNLLIAQIIFCMAKILLLGNVNTYVEGWVGSITGYAGGAAGTTFPLLGLLWLASHTRMKLNRKTLLFACGLLFIGFATAKRAVWFLFPLLFVILYFYYNPIRYLIKKLPVVIIISVLFFYCGARLMPSLNPDNRIGGRFDVEYVFDYAFQYSAGSEEDIVEGEGRLGAVKWMINQFSTNDESVFVGLGTDYVYSPKEGTYTDSSYYQGISSRGAITGVVMHFMAFGLIGVLLFLFYVLSMLRIGHISGLCIISFAVLLFEYIFYTGSIFSIIPLQVMFFYIISKSSYEKKQAVSCSR